MEAGSWKKQKQRPSELNLAASERISPRRAYVVMVTYLVGRRDGNLHLWYDDVWIQEDMKAKIQTM
jgi:hypothetical protein